MLPARRARVETKRTVDGDSPMCDPYYLAATTRLPRPNDDITGADAKRRRLSNDAFSDLDVRCR